MKTPIDQLLAEHRVIEKALRALLGLCGRLERGEPLESNAQDRVFNFLDTFTNRRHQQKEEKCLFPALGARGLPEDRGPLGVILQEHCTGRALIAQMRSASHLHATQQFVMAARNYVDLSSQHIQKEDNILFRVAETLLDEPSMRALQQDFNRADAALPGSHARYEQEADAMERAWT